MKVVSLFVIGFHVLLLIWMALWMPVKPKHKKPIIVRTVNEIAVKPSPKSFSVEPAKQEIKPKKTSSPPQKKTASSKPKNPAIPQSLIKELNESLAKIEGKSHKQEPLKTASCHRSLKLQVDEAAGKEENYAQDLIQYLQSVLELPDLGTVKVELTLKHDGTLLKMRYLESASIQNKKFLENELQRLKYPPFRGALQQQQEHSFVITFCNL